MAVRLDHNVAKVSIEPSMPLSLQLFSKQANIGPYLIRLPILLLWYTVSAAINAIGMPCRSDCMNDPSQHSRADALACDR